MKKAFIFLVLIFLINLPGLYYHWYQNYWWFDTSLHFLGGFFVAMFMADYLRKYFLDKLYLKNTLVIVGATMFVGVMWEFAEFIANQTLTELLYKYFAIRTYFMGNLDDTINDLLMDIIGAIAYVFARRK